MSAPFFRFDSTLVTFDSTVKTFDFMSEAPSLVTPPVETADATVGGIWDTDEGTVSGDPDPTLTITLEECTGP